jgi:hypothetical protein
VSEHPDYERDPWFGVFNIQEDIEVSPAVIWVTDTDGIPLAIGIVGEDEA